MTLVHYTATHDNHRTRITVRWTARDQTERHAAQLKRLAWISDVEVVEVEPVTLGAPIP